MEVKMKVNVKWLGAGWRRKVRRFCPSP